MVSRVQSFVSTDQVTTSKYNNKSTKYTKNTEQSLQRTAPTNMLQFVKEASERRVFLTYTHKNSEWGGLRKYRSTVHNFSAITLNGSKKQQKLKSEAL